MKGILNLEMWTRLLAGYVFRAIEAGERLEGPFGQGVPRKDSLKAQRHLGSAKTG